MKVKSKNLIRGLSLKLHKKAPFTILEILISIALLSVMATLIGFKALDTMEFYRYKQNAARLHDEYKLCEQMALSVGHDIVATLVYKEGKLTLQKEFFSRDQDSCIPKMEKALKPVTLSSTALQSLNNSVIFSATGEKVGPESITLSAKKSPKKRSQFIVHFSPYISLEEKKPTSTL